MARSFARLASLGFALALLPACGGSGGGGGGGAGGGGGGGGPAGPFTSNDPLFANQWHLKNTGQGGGTAGQDANVEPAWTAGFTGSGVRVCVVDDGLEAAHEDLTGNYVANEGLNLAGGTDPTPTAPADNHGTAVAGVAAGRGGNALGATGAAPFAALVGVKPIPGTALETTNALTHNNANTGVYNLSFGPADDGNHYPMTAAFAGPVEQGLLTGRGGRGAIYVRASGNGGNLPDHANLDEDNGHHGVIAVCAVNAAGVKSDYSELGCCNLLAGPSNDTTAPLPGVTCADRTGAAGYDATGNYTSTFGGTSSAAPLVAGVVALVLQANPNLTWRDVRRLLAQTARKNDPADAGWATNGAGRPISHKYGFGTVDAGAAVAAAPAFVSVGGTITTFDSGADAAAAAIPDASAVGVTRVLAVAGATVTNIDVVQVLINVNHASLRNLEFTLTSPSGTVSTLLLSDPAGPVVASPALLTLTTALLLGETTVNGNWTLVVKDLVAGTTGTLNSWQLRIRGS